jgi:CHAD domain-containing protein
MLNPEERELLQDFMDNSQPGMAYRRRAQIILLADDGLSAEDVAAKLKIPVGRVRQFLRVFNRERLQVFPSSMFTPPQPFSPDDPIAEAGRQIMAALIEKIISHDDDLRNLTDVFSIHETRKTCRRVRSAFKIFAPYFETELIESYDLGFRKLMRRLARSRDIAVFMGKFENFRDEVLDVYSLTDQQNQSLAEFERYWRDELAKSDAKAHDYLVKGKHSTLLKRFRKFTRKPGIGVAEESEPETALRTRLVAPVILYQKAAAMRAYDGFIEGASVESLHELRIRCKEMRYTLEIFLPILGPSTTDALAALKRVLTHLGDLNDARMALEMMNEVDDPALAPFMEIYRQEKSAELDGLVVDFPGLWSNINQPSWRLALAEAVSVL